MKDTISDTWYESFFQGINCELWEKAVSQEWTTQEADFLISELNLSPGQQLLDIPCGFGRHAIELAKRGIYVTGVDISETFINKLSETIEKEKLNISVIHEDALTVHLNQKFSAAICMGNSFGYFAFDKMKLFIEKIAASLERGAKFIINSAMIAESILPNFPREKSFTVGDIQMDITNTYNAHESYMVSHILYRKGGKTEEHSFKHYVFTLGEVNRMLRSNGLIIVAAYNAVSKAAFNLGDPQIYIVAEKR